MEELRSYSNGTASASGRLVSGYAVRFGESSAPIGGRYREIIANNAIAPELLNGRIEARFNHDPRKVLANNQDGTLQLELREDGLFYAFEAPANELGDMLVNNIREGKINASSFGFISEPEDIFAYTSAGENFRTVKHIRQIFDVSPVFIPAYTTTSCQVRNQEGEIVEEEPIEETKVEEPIEEVKEETKVEEEKPIVEEEVKPTEEKSVEEEKNINKNLNIRKEMSKDFSLLKLINAKINGETIPAETQEYLRAGASCFNNTINPVGDFQIPFNPKDFTKFIEDPNYRSLSVNDQGEHIVQTDVMDIQGAFEAKSVLNELGADFLYGCRGNVQFPIGSGCTAGWESENGDAPTGNITFSHLTFTPKRLCVQVPVSKTLLIQDTVGAERYIREQIVKSINQELEATILGAESGNTTQPAGMFFGADVMSGVTSMAKIAELEEKIESANVPGEKKYLLNPKVKSAWRTLAKGQNVTKSIIEGKEVDGTPYVVSTNVPANKFIYGKWDELKICQWGALDLTILPMPVNNMINLVVNAYFDAKVLRPEAFAYGKID